MGRVADVLGRLVAPPRCRSIEQLHATVAGKTVIVTGASFGIGESTALLLARAGAEVIMLARSADKLDELVARITADGGRACAHAADLYLVDDVPALAAHLEAEHPRIDIVVLNAGKSIRRRVTESFGRNDLGRSIALNFASPAALSMALLPRMIAQGGGHLVSVSTVSALQPGAPRWGTYQGSKGGFDIWLRSVATELRPQHITATSVYMPLVRTRMSSVTPFYERMPALSAEQAAQVVAAAIVRRRDRISPWWLWWSQLGTLLLRTPCDRALTFLDRDTRSSRRPVPSRRSAR